MEFETNGQTASLRPSVRPSVRSSLCPLCLSRASILWGNKPQCFNKKNNLRNLREGDKIRDQLINTRSLVNYQEIIKIIAIRCHRCTKFDSRRLSVRPSVRLLDGVWHLIIAKRRRSCVVVGGATKKPYWFKLLDWSTEIVYRCHSVRCF